MRGVVWRTACADVVARLTTSTSTSTIPTRALVAQHQRRHATSAGRGAKDDDDDDDDVETSDDYEKMMAMEDSYGSGVMQEEKSGRAETPEEKRQRIALDLERRGVLVGDRVRVAVRVGAPLPERAKKTREGVASEMVRRETMATSSTSSASNHNITDSSTSAQKQRRWMTRAVTGYVVCVRNGRVGVKRTGLADSDEWFPTYPQSWVTVLDVGEMWEMNTGPRNLAGASDDDMYEYQKATGQLKDDDQDVK
jgi:hypothetical protein